MRILTCPPAHFGVDYVINPWMEGQVGRVDREQAYAQWAALIEDVARFASVEQVEPHPRTPDMCFTANAALVLGDRAVPARFRNAERRAEEGPFAEWLTDDGHHLAPLADDAPFEGEGDALFQPGEPLLWAGYGVRTALESHVGLAERFGVEVVSLRLVDARFYHLDTCFAPLPGGRIVYYPPAFDARSRREIERRIPAARRLAVGDADAMGFACNALRIGDRLFLNAASDALREALAEWGFETRIHSVAEFLRAGGGVKCLSLLLEQAPIEASADVPPCAVRAASVELRGDLLDDGLLRRALDVVTDAGGSFRVEALDLAERKDQASVARLRVAAPDAELLDAITDGLAALGAAPVALD
jgi:N-dimethylarginine dimethylaminohydrolase